MNYYCKHITIAFAVGLLLALPAKAQATLDFENIDTLLEDNMLDEATNRYTSILVSFHPEKATLLGFTSAADKLDNRTPQQSAQALASLRSVRAAINQIKEKTLSPSKQTDRNLLLSAVNTSIWEEEQNYFRNNPLYYAAAIDAIYDVINAPASTHKRHDLLARLNTLSVVADQAEQYLTSSAPFLAQLAMEKAYYAHLSAEDWLESLTEGVQNEDILNQANTAVEGAKKSTKRLFDLFKKLSQQEAIQDFRLGEENYNHLLQTRYQLPVQKTSDLLKNLEKRIQTAQSNLTQMLDPFMQQLEEQEITVISDTDSPTTQEAVPTLKAKKKNKKEISPRNAQDFYATAKTFLTASPDSEPLKTLEQDTLSALNFLTDKKVLPAGTIKFSFLPMSRYHAYTRSYSAKPSIVTGNPTFFLRIPSGNQLTQQELFNQDFNAPTRKIMIATALVPGRLYQAQFVNKNSNVRRMYPSQSLQNGWSLYAKRLAKEKGYIGLDEELLFLAWDEYIQALTAWTDAKLHTRQYAYADALDFLTQTHGLTEEQAENIIKQVTQDPARAVSYYVGVDALEKVHAKYSKKYGKKFNEADFNAKLLQIGSVSPADLDTELSRLYQKDNKSKK